MIVLIENIYVRYINFPTTVKAVTTIDEDGNYNIYINSILTFEQQEKALNHELQHIKTDDFYSFENVIFLEQRVEALKI